MDSPPELEPAARAGGRRAAGATYFRSDRERVLEAMLRAAAATGYERAAVTDVTAAAGVSREYFEEQFGDKETCLLEAYDAAIDVALALASNAFEAAAGESWPARVEAALRALIELFSAETEIIRMAMIEMSAVGDRARARYRAALARFAPLLEEGRGHTPRGTELPEDTASFAIGGAASLIFDEVRAGRGAELGRILPALVFAVLMPYLGAEAAEDEMRRVARGG
jgi:AcrR family transcriptional regulator